MSHSMSSQWNRKRRVITSLMGLAWFVIILVLVMGYIPVRTDEATGGQYYWSLLILAVLGILVVAHILFQLVGRHLEYVSFLLNIVLFVSSTTLLTSLLIAFTVGEPLQPWVMVFTSLGVLALLVLVLGQAVALRFARQEYWRQMEDIVWNSARPDVTERQKHALAEACKRIMPIDFGRHDWLGKVAEHPQVWQELKDLLTQHGVEWKDEYCDRVQGLKVPATAVAEQIYFYSGLVGAWLGSLTVVLGTAALGGRSF